MTHDKDPLPTPRSVHKAATRLSCPRCASKRLDKRLNGIRFCRKCGQQWTRSGIELPSVDKRYPKRYQNI